MTLTFRGYTVTDDGIIFDFHDTDNADYTVAATDAELSAVTTANQLRTLLTGKLQRKLLASGISSKLDQFIGQGITI